MDVGITTSIFTLVVLFVSFVSMCIVLLLNKKSYDKADLLALKENQEVINPREEAHHERAKP